MRDVSQARQVSFPNIGDPSGGFERFFLAGDRLFRTVLRRDGSEARSEVVVGPDFEPDPAGFAAAFDAAWLRSKTQPGLCLSRKTTVLRVADLFSGCGGLSLGLSEACRALGMRADFVFACDLDRAAMTVYERNFRPAASSDRPLEESIDGEIGSPPTDAERELLSRVGTVDFVIAGPPCQGHSDLNNHTRRADTKNGLVVRVARFVELFAPTYVMIENVPGIRHDKLQSLAQAKAVLSSLGYSFVESLVAAEKLGVAQSRKRFILMAVRAPNVPRSLLATEPTVPRSLSWAIADLEHELLEGIFDSSARHSQENQRRIRYLFDHGLHELPNAERPACHRDKKHSYTGVYGRMYWDRPAPTITTGFGSAGQGRFVHPRQLRTLTPHEAARVQFFPDFFDFGPLGRRQFQQVIGNAVPSKLAYCVALNQLR